MPRSKRKGGIISQNSSCIKTANLIRMFNRDIKLEKQRLALAELRRKGKLRQALNGLRPGDPLRRRLLSCLSRAGGIRDYIERLFAAKRPASHGQVILFDRGVRNEVGSEQTLLLTDYQYFTSLYGATLQDDGVEYSTYIFN